jgi:hypothetical protein
LSPSHTSTTSENFEQLANLVIDFLRGVRRMTDLIPQEEAIPFAKPMQSDSNGLRTHLQSRCKISQHAIRRCAGELPREVLEELTSPGRVVFFA